MAAAASNRDATSLQPPSEPEGAAAALSLLPPGFSRVLADQGADEADWHAQRNQIVTASEMSTLFGFGEETIAEMAARKQAGRTRDWEDTPEAWWGRHEEIPILRAVERLARVRVHPTHALLGSTSVPRLGATLDAVGVWPDFGVGAVEGWFEFAAPDGQPPDGTTVLVEVKQRRWEFETHWRGRVTHGVRVQAQTQMLVTGVGWNLVVARLDTSTLRLFLMKADPEAHAEILKRHARFREKVKAWNSTL